MRTRKIEGGPEQPGATGSGADAGVARAPRSGSRCCQRRREAPVAALRKRVIDLRRGAGVRERLLTTCNRMEVRAGSERQGC